MSIPFQTFENGDAQLEFVDAVLKLDVTPHITADKQHHHEDQGEPERAGRHRLHADRLARDREEPGQDRDPGQGRPDPGARWHLLIDKSQRQSRVPYLHPIPILGVAFRNNEISDSRKELLIFVTPRIVAVQAEQAAAENRTPPRSISERARGASAPPRRLYCAAFEAGARTRCGACEASRRLRARARAERRGPASGERTSPMQIGSGTLLGPGASRRTAAARRGVTVPGVGRRYAGRVLRSLRTAGMRVQRIDVPDGDATKNLRQVARLYDALLERGLDRGIGAGGARRRHGRRSHRLRGGDLPARHPVRPGADDAARHGGREHRRQGRASTCRRARTWSAPSTSRAWSGSTSTRCARCRRASAPRASPRSSRKAAIWDAAFFARLERDAEALMALEPRRLLAGARAGLRASRPRS